jgi:hypothetical protein
LATPGAARAAAAAFSTCASISRPASGLIWIVTSREICERHPCEALATSIAPPAVRQDRKVMIAMTETRARPAIELAGTSGMSRLRRETASSSSSWRRSPERSGGCGAFTRSLDRRFGAARRL